MIFQNSCGFFLYKKEALMGMNRPTAEKLRIIQFDSIFYKSLSQTDRALR